MGRTSRNGEVCNFQHRVYFARPGGQLPVARHPGAIRKVPNPLPTPSFPMPKVFRSDHLLQAQFGHKLPYLFPDEGIRRSE